MKFKWSDSFILWGGLRKSFSNSTIFIVIFDIYSFEPDVIQVIDALNSYSWVFSIELSSQTKSTESSFCSILFQLDYTGQILNLLAIFPLYYVD